MTTLTSTTRSSRNCSTTAAARSRRRARRSSSTGREDGQPPLEGAPPLVRADAQAAELHVPEIPERPIVLSELFGSVFGARIVPDGGADAAAAAAPAVDDGPALGGVSLFGDAVAAAPAPASTPAPAPRRRRPKKTT